MDYKTQQRLGFRTPRSILLPPYFLNNAYYVEFMDAIDEVFWPLVDSKMQIIQNLRNMWSTDPNIEQKVLDGSLLAFSDWPQPERDLLVKQTNMLGMKFTNASVVSNDAYQMITRFVGQYWFQKGTQAFIEFINYCLGTNLQVISLWTEDYSVFVAEELAGTPIWEGGTWYPTTHVQISTAGGFENLDVGTLISFFYEIANYNLVLNAVDARFDSPIVAFQEDAPLTKIVALGLYAENRIVMSNTQQFGADPPPTYDGSPSATTRYYGPAVPDFTSLYYLGLPSSWIEDSEGRKFPVYSVTDQTITTDSDIPTSYLVNELPAVLTDVATDVAVLTTPDIWVPIPGSSRSTARIPAYSAEPSINAVSDIGTRMIGRQRSQLLANPRGFVTMNSQLVPYW